MASNYKLIVRNTAGSKLAEIGFGSGSDPAKAPFSKLACTRRVNEIGKLQVQFSGENAILDHLTHRCQVELWCAGTGIAWYREFMGLYLAQEQAYEELRRCTLTAPELKWLLSTRIVNWPAGTANRSKFTAAKAETIMKTLVDYNAGANATAANGRKRDGAITGVTIQADGANGNALDWNCFGDILLETLQKLAPGAGGDFDLVKTAAATYQLQWFTGQLGTDRTASVIFALERGNMGAPSYKNNRIDEKTVACVWGQDEGANRAYTTRTGPDYSASNDIEMFVEASNADTAGGLNAEGDAKLYETRAVDEFAFDVLQTPACRYGLHYFMGDLVTVRNPFTGTSAPRKIMAVSRGLAGDGAETVDIEMKVL